MSGGGKAKGLGERYLKNLLSSPKPGRRDGETLALKPVCRPKRGRGLLFFFLLAAFSLAVACGVKVDPYPEAATLPNKVIDLTQALTADGELILSWKPPRDNMAGRQLKKIGGFVIEMSDNTASESYCEGCPHQYQRVDVVPAASPPPGLEIAPGPYSWRYKLHDGHVYRFRVYGMAPGGGVHPGSQSEVTVWAQSSPGVLAGFSASLGDKAVEIGWARPGKDLRAEVEKRAGDSGPWQALNGLDPASGRFSDLAVDYEKTYFYRGRLASLKGGSSRPGPWSKEVAVNVADVTPPPPPGHLDAALTEGGVRLSWESVAFDPDLAGYRLYRQLEGEAGFTRLTSALIKDNKFFDPLKLRDGTVARYQVTAVDKSPRANESRPSPGADVYLDPPAEYIPRPE